MIVIGGTMSEWREIEKILAKLGHTTITLVRKNGILRRVFSVRTRGHHWSGATGGPRGEAKLAQALQGPLSGPSGDALIP